MKVVNVNKEKTSFTVKFKDSYELRFSLDDNKEPVIVYDPKDDFHPIDICTEKELDQAREAVRTFLNKK